MTPAEFAQLHRRAFDPEARGWRAVEFEELLADPTTLWAGDTRAFAMIRIVADEGEVLTLACDPDYRRQGLALTCLAGVIAKAVARGAQRLFLEVAADNLPALELYKKVGFERVGLRRGYYNRAGSDPVDALVLEMEFASAG